jgi:hypothetical protein
MHVSLSHTHTQTHTHTHTHTQTHTDDACLETVAPVGGRQGNGSEGILTNETHDSASASQGGTVHAVIENMLPRQSESTGHHHQGEGVGGGGADTSCANAEKRLEGGDTIGEGAGTEC